MEANLSLKRHFGNSLIRNRLKNTDRYSLQKNILKGNGIGKMIIKVFAINGLLDQDVMSTVTRCVATIRPTTLQ